MSECGPNCDCGANTTSNIQTPKSKAQVLLGHAGQRLTRNQRRVFAKLMRKGWDKTRALSEAEHI